MTSPALPTAILLRSSTWLGIACGLALAAGDPLSAQAVEPLPEGGIAIESETVVQSCRRCHRVDDTGRMSRLSYLRKTPEGWQTSIRRMVTLNQVDLEPEVAREILRYLSNNHGLAPEELRPGRFEVERRLIDYSYEADEDVEFTCIQCHSMGRVITQRRTREEWDLLIATHRGLYPLSDFQAFRRGGSNGGFAMDDAIGHLSRAFPLETPEWTSWSATMRPARLAGAWALSGHAPGGGPIYGRMEVTAGDATDEFVTRATYTFARDGRTVTREGSAIVYTGYQWRGRSFEGSNQERALREVMLVERDWQEMSGRWFTGAYDELGPDVTLRRAEGGAVLTGLYPGAVRAGSGSTELRVYGVDLPGAVAAADVDFGPGVTVEAVSALSSEGLTLRVQVADEARPGARDLFVGGVSLRDALVVYDAIDRIEVSPPWGMARVGGANFPKGYQQFEAVGFSNGPDGEAETEDDLRVGLVEAQWSMEEYSATLDDDDLDFVGSIDQRGLFTPAADGPNADRRGNRNNVGDVWVVATYHPPGSDEPRIARAHLLVTVPLYLRFDPWGGDR